MRKSTRKLKSEKSEEILKRRMREWRKGPAIERVKKPSKIERARKLGYKEKEGVVVARARVRSGGRRKSRPSLGRRPKRMGVRKITPKKSIQRIAEERTARKFPNLEVLNSYPIGKDGKYHYFESILIDPNHPAITSDPDLSWVSNSSQRGRAYRGLTSEGKKTRGLRKKGKGSEKNRPSQRSARH
ncbi:50S ribosomal protein L15e [candidate division MSBL1 archaeon SCGC-AAA261F17]|uniref:Large ribosomal subunit protein eL15 n=4 Tax=candidate division MSBL1 TaxID=215777 RepID=A0A133V1I0_9EURY|nr:50S ribosomal protein L15e [candidate division MSBL1 archaeon SCGC-AAA261C02]KXB02311.1 50S ribosomal protein L15e [candidate division MSBL1 archaeon SCGC-AAA261F17]KXB04165.1 50S ribosomal protein L15e [candidate division MSBL1 archaeon SCGC-AAA261G05]KXB04376.1 50S ribosomal protein L15e [candidate division MSBL1 archaeon SCGC-AAA261O19]